MKIIQIFQIADPIQRRERQTALHRRCLLLLEAARQKQRRP